MKILIAADGNNLQSGNILLCLPDQVNAVNLRHLHIRDQDVRRMVPDKFQCVRRLCEFSGNLCISDMDDLF